MCGIFTLHRRRNWWGRSGHGLTTFLTCYYKANLRVRQVISLSHPLNWLINWLIDIYPGRECICMHTWTYRTHINYKLHNNYTQTTHIDRIRTCTHWGLISSIYPGQDSGMIWDWQPQGPVNVPSISTHLYQVTDTCTSPSEWPQVLSSSSVSLYLWEHAKGGNVKCWKQFLAQTWYQISSWAMVQPW